MTSWHTEPNSTAASRNSDPIKKERLASLSIFSYILLTFIRCYQFFISPLLGNCCRFSPTCSQHMVNEIREKGAIWGIYGGLKQLLKCHPWSKPTSPPYHHNDPS